MNTGQKVIHKDFGRHGIVVPNKSGKVSGKDWFTVFWTLPSGRQEKREEHRSTLKAI